MPRALRIEETFDVPLREISGLAIQRVPGAAPRLVAIGDESFEVVSAPLGPNGPGPFSRTDVHRLVEELAKRGGSQWEAIACDAAGNVFVLQEDPLLVFAFDPTLERLLGLIELDRGDAEGNSSGEGLLLLGGGHLLVVQEKDPPALVELGPEGNPARGVTPADLVPSTFALAAERASYVALARWDLSRRDLKDIGDLSDVTAGPDGQLYMVSDQERCILQLGPSLGAGGGTVELAGRWELPKRVKKPEGLVILEDRRPLVAIDRDAEGKNLFLLEPLGD